MTATKSTAKDTSQTSKKLDSLLEALKGDLSSLKTDDSIKMIDEWHSLVQQSKEPEFKEIATGLKDLQKLLKSKDAGHDLGELLSHLGEQTSNIAADADKEIKLPLQNLGKQLAKVGRSLAKEEDQHHLGALDSLVEVLDQDAEEIDSKSASDGIDHWYDLLHKSEDDSLKAIATEIKELKQLLKGKKTKASDLSEKLILMGEQTTKASSLAARGFKGAIQKLGKALTKLGKSLDSKEV